jgi:putative oxidoreductase
MIGRLLLRGTVGGFFIGHGAQKLFGAFGGHGLKGTGQFFESLGMRPGHVHATAAGLAETGGGAAILLGAETPLAAAGIIGTMLTAIHRVHFKNGPWSTNGGYEYNAVLIAAVTLLAEIGPGPISIDRLRGVDHSGAAWGLAALGLGAAGAAGAHLLAESSKAAPETPPAPAAAPAPDTTVEITATDVPQGAGVGA